MYEFRQSIELILLFFFYIGDKVDRAFLILIFLPLLRYYEFVLKNLKKENLVIKLIVGFFLIQECYSFFVACKGTLFLDPDLSSGNKTLGV